MFSHSFVVSFHRMCMSWIANIVGYACGFKYLGKNFQAKDLKESLLPHLPSSEKRGLIRITISR